MRKVNADKRPLRALRRVIGSWGFIGALFVACCAAVWKYLETTNYAPYLIGIGFAFCAFLASARVFTKRRLKYAVAALVLLVCLILAFLVERPEKPHVVQWLPPELPPGCTNVIVKFGSQILSFPIPNGKGLPEDQFLKLADIRMRIGSQTFTHPLRPELKNNRVYVSITVPHHNERKRISMDNALDHDLPPMWDRNFTSNAFEIVQEDYRPVLQVIYRRAEIIEIYGVFVLDKNHVYMTFGPTNAIWLQNLTTDSTNITVDSTSRIIPSTAYKTDVPQRKSIFKYPSWKYMGMFFE